MIAPLTAVRLPRVGAECLVEPRARLAAGGA
jgi:hypothetical protein